MLPPNTYKVDDFETIRQTIFDDALNSLSNRFPLENDKYRLTVEDLGYDSIPKYTTLQQKEAVQSDKTLSAKIKGRWTLYDKNTGKIVSQSSRKTIMDVPYMTERGTFIRNGTEMTLPIQMRLVPGVYARMTDSGEAKAHINVKPGSGSQLSITMNPANPVFKVTQGTRNYKLYPLLKHMGISDEYLMNAWGKDIYKANYDDFISGGGWYSAKTAAEENPYDEITKRVFRGDLDPLETEASLGKGYKTVDPDMMVAAASKLLRISKGEAESDNRDSLENQRFLMAPELIGERVRLDAGKVGQTLLWKISRSGDVNKIPAGALNKYINGLFTESRLAQAIEETNPLDAYMRATKVTRMGEGGISGVDTAPMSARLVHNTYKGFIDPTVSPECCANHLVMSNLGWVEISKVTEDTLIACLIDGKLEYHKPYKVVSYDFNGELYCYNAKATAYEVTGNHRMWSRLDDFSDYTFEFAENIFNTHRIFWSGADTYTDDSKTEIPIFANTPDETYHFKKPYDGKVYCLSVPGGLFYTKLPGKRPFWIGNSLRAGLDSAIALNAVKGKDGFMYTPMINAISGRREYVNSLVASKVPVAFSEYRDSTQKYIPAMVGNKIEYLPKANVKYFIPNGDSLFALSSNLIPLKSGIKAGRLLMAQKHQTQAVSLSSRMAPYVQTEHPGDNTISVEKSIGKLMGAVFSKGDGKVLSVTPDEMTVRYNDGTKETISLYNNYPLNRKSYYHNESRVKPGDIIKKGQVLASSNYTDENGVSALGTQLRTAWMPFKGENYLDAIIVSEDAAKKLSSEHLYHTGVDKDSTTTIDKNAYTSAFPTKFNKDQLATIDKDGIVKPGTTVKFGDPLILSYSKREATPGSLHRALVKDNVVTWEHEFPGYITDVVNSSKGVKVYTKAYLPLQTGDKCFSEDTDLLTENGWKNIKDVTLDDKIATLNPETNVFEYLTPVALHKIPYVGYMYTIDTPQVNTCVTPYHNNFVQTRNSDHFELIKAENCFNRRISFKKDGIWNGKVVDTFTFPGLPDVKGFEDPLTIDMASYLVLLGMFLSEGSCVWNEKHRNYNVNIVQLKPEGVLALKAAEKKYNIGKYFESQGRLINRDKRIVKYFMQFGHAKDKFIPNHVFALSSDQQRLLLDWLMWGDGTIKDGLYKSYTTISERLANDIQRLCLHIGISAHIKRRKKLGGGNINGRPIMGKYICYNVKFVNKKLTPQINHGHVEVKQDFATYYNGYVYCPTMPKWNVVYTRRNGVPMWSGNCAARYANKGVTARVVPTSEMPIAADGKPIDVIFGPTGIVSRVNSAQLVEAMLGKVAAKTGKRYVLPGFMNENMVEFAKRELEQAGLTDREDLTDPTTGVTIPQITVGNSYIVKMHHTAESKGGARATGAYTMDELPGGQGHDGSKLLGNLILGAIIGHGCFVGSTNILTDHGYMEIGNIVKHRLPVNVYSYNKDTDTFEYRPVINWFVYSVDDSEMWEIQTTLNDSPIRCTKDHKFYTPNGLIKASNLQCNDPVYVGDSTTISGPELSYVTKSAPYNRPDYDTSLVYDITVEHNHNFIAAGVLVSNSTEVLKDMKLVKGQKNTDFWRDFKLGRTPVMPSTPLIYDKFIASLQGAGINVHKEKNTTNIFALTNKDINDFAHAEVKNSDTYSANNMAPLPGGLFDPNIFGPNGTQWGYIKLDEPVLNPVMEDPIKLILGLTEADLEAVISGNKKLPNGLTGGLGLKKQLESINMKQAVQDALNDVKNATRTKRDKAVKKYRYLSSMLKHNASPADFMLDKIPVIPPRFRRISQSGDLTMVADANYLYRALMDNQQDVRDARNAGLPEDMVGGGNLKIYKAFKAITGLSDPEDRKLQEKQVSGLLKWVFGKGSPKCYDSETEILTENGWVKFPEYLDSTIKVATLNPSTDAFEWQTPTDIIHMPYSGDMIYTHTRYLDSMVTPNHNHYVSLRTGKGINSRWTPFAKEQASNLVDVVKRVRYKTAASKYIGSTPNTFDITPNANAFATFVGWYVAEGWIHTDNTIAYIAVKAHGRDESILTDLFDNNTFKYKKAYYTTKAAKVSPYGIKTPAGYEMVYFSFYSKELCQWLRENVGASCYTKRLSSEILDWSSEYLINVWEGFHAGDGEKRSGLITTNSKKTWQSRKSFTDRGNRAYTVSKDLAESFVELGLKIGASVNYVKNKEVYRISVHAFDYSVAEYRHQTSKVPYDGMVHCVTVPNGLVFVRRNGKVLVSGNSGAYQRNVVGGSLDVAGRNVITPNASFRLDEIGLPKKEAWTLYQDFVIRRLVQNGMDPLVATKEVTNKTKLAEDALRQVVSERPVLATRAPALHKYSIMAFRPRLVESETLQLNPAIQKPFNADHDGDDQVGRVIIRFKRNIDVPFKYRLDF